MIVETPSQAGEYAFSIPSLEIMLLKLLLFNPSIRKFARLF